MKQKKTRTAEKWDVTTQIVMDALRNNGIQVVSVSDEMAREFIKTSSRREEAQFRMVSQDLMYSNARHALNRIRQDKASPQQWLAMLHKAGGIKTDEDRWTGLTDWLMKQPPTALPKASIEEYLNSHSIRLHEEHFVRIKETEHYKKLQKELEELAASVDDRYQEADNALDEFYNRMRDLHGEDFEYEMTAEEVEEEDALQQERDRWDTSEEEDAEYYIAFGQMEDKYGEKFSEAFCLHDKGLDFYDKESAYRYISEWCIDETRLNHTTAGLDDYRELAFWVEDIKPYQQNEEIHFGQVGNGRCIGWVRFGETSVGDEKILVIDEVQSSRHQDGRENGYELTEEEMQKRMNEWISIKKEKKDYEMFLMDKYGTCLINDHANEEEKARLQDLYKKSLDIDTLVMNEKTRPPRAPFEKNWHELCMKRMLRYAAENGFDKVAWTTGEQQGLRYNLRKYVDIINVQPQTVNGKEMKFVDVIFKNESHTTMFVNEEGYISGAEEKMKRLNGNHVNKVFGKKVGEQMMANRWGCYGEKDLKIGGEGMKAFYDRIIPNFLNHYGKKWEAKVEPLVLSHLNGSNGYKTADLTMHAIEVTPAMKASVLQGQPMFMKNREGKVYGWTLDNVIYLTPCGMNAETGIHEYTHLWAEVMQRKDKAGWEHIKHLLKDSPVWKAVLRDRNYRHLRNSEDRLASEALARISGQDNAAKLEQAVKQVSNRDRSIRGVEQMKQALCKFWSWVGKHVFHIKKAQKLADVTDRILGDLLRGDNIRIGMDNPRLSDIQVKMFGRNPNATPRIRCKVDGEQQMFKDISKKEFKAYEQEKNPIRKDNLLQTMASKYFAEQLITSLSLSENKGMKR